jgi:hypothetical protein
MTNNPVLQWLYTGLMWVYLAGYAIYLFMAGWTSWSNMTFWDWCVHVSWESVYALAWPVLVIMSLTGHR